MERLDKFLCDSGVGTRSQVKALLKTGRVLVDQKPEKDGSRKIDPAVCQVTLDGEPLAGYRRLVVMLNKPAGYITATEDPTQQTVMELLPQAYRHLDLKPVGRLDKQTEGLLLFTNDGEFANGMTHPKHMVEKVYEVWASGYTPGGEKRLSRPVVLDGYRIHPPKVVLLSAKDGKARFQITIHEGRNRQIRRMCEMAGMRCTRLRRIQEGSLKLGSLPCGAWRYLTSEEAASLK